jgi:hypothetical protein
MRGPRHIMLKRKWPERYFTGLSPKMSLVREKELLRRRSLPYSKLSLAKSNAFARPKKSKWTPAFHKEYPGLTLGTAHRTGIKRSILDTVYNRGMKAWKTGGSRVGATPQQWGAARVYKFILVSTRGYPSTKFDPNQNLRAKSRK